MSREEIKNEVLSIQELFGIKSAKVAKIMGMSVDRFYKCISVHNSNYNYFTDEQLKTLKLFLKNTSNNLDVLN